MEISSQRNNFIDVAKGFSIFLMLWGHCIQYCAGSNDIDFFGNAVFKTIYSFHMPLFALISGYLFFYSFSKRNLKELLIYRTKALLQPIVFCSVFHFLILDVLMGMKAGNFSLFFTSGWTKYFSSLWFLWSILAASISVAIIYKKCNNAIGQGILLIVFMSFVSAFPNGTYNQYIYPFFVMGFLYAKYKEKIPKYIYTLKYLTLPLFPVMTYFYGNNHYIYTTGLFSTEFSTIEMISIDLYRWAIGLVGSIFTLVVLKGIYEIGRYKFEKNTLFDGLSKLGKDSLAMYALSVPLLSSYLPIVFPKLLSACNMDSILVENTYIYTFGVALLTAILYSFLLHFIIRIFKKIKIFHVFFG